MQRHHRKSEPQSQTEALLFGVFAICFGLFWTVMAGSIFPPMAIFGILWTAIAVTKTVNSCKNAKKNTGTEDFSREEPQNRDYPQESNPPEELRCPYCGAPISRESEKCEYCDSEF